MDPRDEAAFDKVGREELAHIEESLADVDPDDIEISVSDGVLTLTLRDGVRVVINTHRAARQIWMAAVRTHGTSTRRRPTIRAVAGAPPQGKS